MNAKSLTPLLLAVFALSSCAKYERQDGCHLEKMNVKGNVTKIETIVETTMPLTELFADSFDPSETVSMYSGNTEITFDKRGNVKHSRGYGVDGRELYDEDFVLAENEGMQSIPCFVGTATANQKIDDVKIITEDDRIVNVKYYSGGKLIWDQNVSYDKEGYIERIVKEYTSMNIKVDNFTITYKDSTTYQYFDQDSHGNWTKARVTYKGILPAHACDYTIIRQLTYDGEEKHDKLINRLVSVNAQPKEATSDFAQIRMGTYGTMRVPRYMAMKSKDFISEVASYYAGMPESLFMFGYDKKDADASILVSVYVGNDNGFVDELVSEGRRYNKELDDYLCEMLTNGMAQGGVYVLKWLPYEIIRISGKDVLKLTYYRYARNPIPFYCEHYSIPMNDGNTLSIVFSYQSNLANRFQTDFTKAVGSIDLN